MISSSYFLHFFFSSCVPPNNTCLYNPHWLHAIWHFTFHFNDNSNTFYHKYILPMLFCCLFLEFFSRNDNVSVRFPDTTLTLHTLHCTLEHLEFYTYFARDMFPALVRIVMPKRVVAIKTLDVNVNKDAFSKFIYTRLCWPHKRRCVRPSKSSSLPLCDVWGMKNTLIEGAGLSKEAALWT